MVMKAERGAEYDVAQPRVTELGRSRAVTCSGVPTRTPLRITSGGTATIGVLESRPDRIVPERYRQTRDETHENCPRNTLGASRKSARETVTVVRHGKWVVDGGSCRDHGKVCQDVCEGFEEGQGADSGSGGRGDWLVAGQRPAQAVCSGEGVAGIGS